MSDDERPDSFTAANPVAHILSCSPCNVTVSGDNLPDELRRIFEERHRDCP